MFSGSIVAIVTPMQVDGSIDWPAWERLLAMHVQAGTNGIVVGGSTGESGSLSDAELGALLTRARDCVGGRLPVIAGVGTSATASTIARAKVALAAGADALLVVTPPYNRPTQEGLYRHFAAVAAAVDKPLIPYNVPTRTAVDLLPTTVARLARLPAVVAVKESVTEPQRLRELAGLTSEHFCVLSGDDATAVEAMRLGAKGVISVTANVCPRGMSAVCAAALAGDFARAVALDRVLQPLHEALFVESNPIPTKWALQHLGLIDRGIRLPLTELSEAARPRVSTALDLADVKPLLPQARIA